MTQDQRDAFEAVKKINSELESKWFKKGKDKDLLPMVAITFVGRMFFISLSLSSEFHINLPEINLYNSVNSDRIYYEKLDKYESFYKLIKRKFILVKEEINKIKL